MLLVGGGGGCRKKDMRFPTTGLGVDVRDRA